MTFKIDGLVKNALFFRLKEMDKTLTFWSVGRQKIGFMFYVQDVVFPVECKTGRLRSNDTRLIWPLSEKWGAPSILRVPAFML